MDAKHPPKLRTSRPRLAETTGTVESTRNSPRTAPPRTTGGPHFAPTPAEAARQSVAVPAEKAAPKKRQEPTWREAFVHWLAPGVVTGMPLGDWVGLLAENRFRVEPRYWPRAAFVTGASLLSSAFGLVEKAAYGRKVAATEVPPPLFVLGHWRSGTTHLHNLLAVDDRYASPRFSEVMLPKTFLTGEWVLTAALAALLPKTRFGIDNMALSMQAPSEEEFALAQLTRHSPYTSWAFPKNAAYYDRCITFRDLPEREVREWQAGFTTFLKKLTLKDRKPQILKSPPNTGRIKLLLEIFPDAKFVHIHRDPYTVYQSTHHLHAGGWRNYAFQKLDESTLRERVLSNYEEMMGAFFEERSLIPEGRFAEVAFDDLEADPLGQVERVYGELGLGGYDLVRPKLEAYVGTLAGYRKNKHIELPADLRDEIARRWERSFEEWGYRA